MHAAFYFENKTFSSPFRPELIMIESEQHADRKNRALLTKREQEDGKEEGRGRLANIETLACVCMPADVYVDLSATRLCETSEQRHTDSLLCDCHDPVPSEQEGTRYRQEAKGGGSKGRSGVPSTTLSSRGPHPTVDIYKKQKLHIHL